MSPTKPRNPHCTGPLAATAEDILRSYIEEEMKAGGFVLPAGIARLVLDGDDSKERYAVSMLRDYVRPLLVSPNEAAAAGIHRLRLLHWPRYYHVRIDIQHNGKLGPLWQGFPQNLFRQHWRDLWDWSPDDKVWMPHEIDR